MADEQIITNIVATADLSSLVSEVHRATASLQNLQQQLSSAGKTVASQVKVINNSFGETLRSTGQFGSHFVTLHSDVEKFGKGLDAGRLKIRDFYSAFQQHAKTSGGLIRELARQQVMLQNAVMQPLGRNAQGLMQYEVHIPRGLDLVKNKTRLANMELQIMNRAINEGATSLINWGKNTQWAGRQLTVGLTVPIAAFGAAAAKAFREADQELTRLTKVYGDVSGTTAKELGVVRSEITKTSKELATTMGVNFKETISLAADIAATGKQGNELLGSLKETTRLAVLGEVDRQEAMKATLAIQSAFKQNTEQLSESINFLNAVENQTSTTLNDLVEAIPKAGPVIKGLGGSVQDLALYLTAMREGGINASEGANALKSALASLINPTDKAVEKFEGFGIDILGIVNNNAGNVTNTLFALQAALDKLDPLSKQQAIEQLFGKFQFSRLNALFENLGKQGSQTLQVLDLMKASAGDLEALAARELTAVTESASGQYRRAIEGLRAEMSVLGEDFLDIGTKFINVVTKLLKFLNNLPDPVKKLVTAFAGLTAVAGPIIMLTGVLANFAGYILKGATNLKMLLSGSKGWKMLTPEIIAANHAAKTISDTFYSDAQAAAILEQALRNLVDEFNVLQTAVNNGNISVQPAIRTLAGSTIMSGGQRVVDPTHPLAGEIDTRAFSHINPRKSGYASGSILGVLPGAIPVNQKIGATPQIYMSERLPNIEGLTSVGGVSTGIVSGEAAKFHALMATLSMQTQNEVELLKKTVSLGGTINSDLLNTYDDLLPITQQFATKAANESAIIVAELRAAKITVDQAKAKILALNAQIDAEMTAALASYAASRGLPFDPTKAPLIDQPATDPSGKYNLRDMFKRSASRGVLEEFGRLRGIKTFGAPYSIEVTKLPKFNKGGDSSEAWVPGPNVNADVVPAMLTPGEFVVRRDIAQQDPEGLAMYNAGQAEIVPIQRNRGGIIPGVQYRFGGGPIVSQLLRELHRSRSMVSGAMSLRPRSSGGTTASHRQIVEPGGHKFHRIGRSPGSGERGKYWKDLLDRGVISKEEYEEVLSSISRTGQGRWITAHAVSPRFQARFGGPGSRTDYPEVRVGDIPTLVPGASISSRTLSRESQDTTRLLPSAYATMPEFGGSQGLLRGYHMGSLGEFLLKTNLPPALIRKILDSAARRMNAGNYSNKTSARDLYKDLAKAEAQAIMEFADEIRIATGVPFAANRGGMVPGYNRGGRIARSLSRAGGRVRRGRRFYGERQSPGYTVVDRRASQATMGVAGSPTFPPSSARTVSSSVPRGSIVDRLRLAGYMPGPTSSPLNIQEGQIKPGPAPRSMGMGKMLGYGMVGGTAGSMLGSNFGQMGMILGGTVGSFLPQIIMGLKAASAQAGGLFRILKSLTIPGLILTTLTLVTKGLLAWKKSAEEAGKANRLAFGGTDESFTSVGIKKYKEMSDRIKDINEKLELHRDKVRSTYESYTRTGTPGLTLTIKELRDAIKNAKENQEDYVNAFNNIDSGRVVQYAAQLKAQFVAMGMSAQEATNQIYAIVKASEKAGQALAAITSKDFTSISDSVSGIAMLIKSLRAELNSEDFNAEEFNAGLDTLLNSIIIYKDALVGTMDANKNVLDQADALQLTMEKISEMTAAKKELSQDNLESLKNENVLYYSILGSVETIESITAKIMLYQSGFANVVDLASMGAEAAVAFAKNLATVQNVMNSITEDTSTGTKNPLLPLANIIARVKKESEDAATVVKKLKKVDEDYYNNKIDSIRKTIKALQEERAARLKALDVQEQAQSYEVQLSQAQIRYSQAVATGDLALAAQEQLAIEKLVADRQRQLTRDKINDTYDAKIDKLEKQIEDLQKELKGAQDSYNAKTAAATQKAADLAALQSYRDRLEEIALRNYGKPVMNKTDAQEISNIFEEMIKAGGETKTAAEEMRKAYGLGSGVYQMGWQQALVNALNNQVGSNAEFKSAVDEFAAAVKVFANKGEGTLDNKKIVSFSGKTGQVNVKDLYDADISPTVGNKFKTKQGQEYEIVEVSGNSVKVKRLAQGGTVQYFGPGGNVSGPGTSTSDSIPAYLSDGEYVIRAAAVDHYGKETFDAMNAKKLKDGGPIGKNKSSYSDTVNLDGQIFTVNRGTQSQILADIKAAYDAEPNVKSFKDRIDYYQAIEEWNKKYSFVIPSKGLYPTSGSKYPLGSLSRFLSVAESQAAGSSYNAFYDANLTSHAFKSFSPQSDRQVKDLLNTAPNEVFNRLGELEQLNKFSIEANKKYKLGSDLLAWCGAFVAWVAEQSGVNISKKMFSAFGATEDYKDLGLFKDPSSKLNIGDIIWWDWAKKFAPGSQKYKNGTPGIPDHVDIITGKSGKSIFTTIGGGYGGSVGKKTRDFSKEAQALYGSVTPEFQSFKDGGMVKPTIGIRDPNQSFINRLLFGINYIGGNTKTLKAEMPFGPGSVAKLFHGTHKLLKAGDIISPSGRTLYTASTGKHIYAGTDVDTAAFWGKRAAEKVGTQIGKRFRSYVYEIEPLGKTIIDQMTPDARMIEGAARVIGMIKKSRSIKSPLGFAGGGYVNPSYTSNMNLPSFDDGANNIYADMIAKVHKNEAVIPAEFNPWNPTASKPLMGDNVVVNMTNTYNIPENMSKEDIGRYIVDLQRKDLARIGLPRNNNH